MIEDPKCSDCGKVFKPLNYGNAKIYPLYGIGSKILCKECRKTREGRKQ